MNTMGSLLVFASSTNEEAILLLMVLVYCKLEAITVTAALINIINI